MSDANEQQQDVAEQEQRRPLTLGRGGGKLELRKPVETAQVRQSFSHGRSKTVTVEVRKKRTLTPGAADPGRAEAAPAVAREHPASQPATTEPTRRTVVLPRTLTAEESSRRTRVVQEEARRRALVEEDRRRQEQERAAEEARRRAEEEERTAAPRRSARPEIKRPAAPVRRDEVRRRTGKITVTRALSDDEGERVRSLASVRRARERERLRLHHGEQEQVKVVREVVVPETITVQELANRMAERGADVIKALM